MADERDFRVRCDFNFSPTKEGEKAANDFFMEAQKFLDKAVNINPDTVIAEIGYCSFERCGHRIGEPCEVIENHYVE